MTAGDVRAKAEVEGQPDYVTKLRLSWKDIPMMGRVNPGDREDSRALEFKLPPPMDLTLGESGIWLFR